VTTSGGLVGGDRLDVGISVGEGASAMVVAQAAEKVYRSAGADCAVSVSLAAGEGAWLEWLPQETILFDGARLRRRTRLEAAPGGRILAGEMLVFGRLARGETLTHGLLREEWEVRLGGRLRWCEALHLDGDVAATLNHPAGLAGAVSAATIVYVADDAASRLPIARDLLGDFAGRAAATCVNGQLVMRWLSADAPSLRASYGAVWAGFRRAVGGLPGRLPRLWHV
jgi:urease accessory protein